MGSPQPGIFALGTNSHAYLELDLAPGAQPLDAVALVASLREPRTTIGGVNLVAGFRPELWADDRPRRRAGGRRRVRRAGPRARRLRAAGDAARHRRLAHRRVLRRRLRPVGRASSGAGRPGDARQRDRRLAVSPRSGPDRVHRRHREPVARRRDDGRGHPRGRGRARAAASSCSSSGSTTPPRGRHCRSRRRSGHGPAQGRQRRARPAAADVARRPDGPGHASAGSSGGTSPTAPSTGTARSSSGFSADQRILGAMLDSMVGRSDGPPDALTRYARALTRRLLRDPGRGAPRRARCERDQPA